METSERQQYVNTLARLIETRHEHDGNDDGQREVDRAISRMKHTVVTRHGEEGWGSVEQAASRAVNPMPRPAGLRKTPAGIVLL